MKRIIVPAILAGVFALVLVTGQVRGDGPPPPPPPGGGTPLATIAPPCSPSGCPTNTPLPTATPLPTSTPTSTPIPLFLHVKLWHKTVRAGKKQRITIISLPSVAITILIAFPNRTRFTRHVSAQDDGYFRLTFTQPKKRTTVKNHVVKVTVNVVDATGATKHSIKRYRVP